MNPKIQRLLRDVIIAICSAIITFLSSCSLNCAIGDYNSPVIEQHPSLSADSTNFVTVGH